MIDKFIMVLFILSQFCPVLIPRTSFVNVDLKICPL